MKVCRESIHADAPDYVEIPVNLLEIPGEKWSEAETLMRKMKVSSVSVTFATRHTTGQRAPLDLRQPRISIATSRASRS